MKYFAVILACLASVVGSAPVEAKPYMKIITGPSDQAAIDRSARLRLEHMRLDQALNDFMDRQELQNKIRLYCEAGAIRCYNPKRFDAAL